MTLTIDQTQLQILCGQEGISFLGLFGSYARDEARDSSDIDLLVDFRQTKSFFQLAQVQARLEQLFGKRVDLVLKNSVKNSLQPFIQHDLITLYGKN